MLSLRRALSADVPSLVKVANAAYGRYVARIGRPPAPMTADYDRLMEQAEIWVAEDETELVGMLVLIENPGHLLLDNVAVIPSAQGRGIGAGLLRQAEKRARERGLARFIGYSGDGAAARYAVECGRFDTLQTSVSIADQEALELTLPLARSREMGVIAKRPLANVAWRYARKPAEPYYQTYWSRLRTLDYGFLAAGGDSAVATALRFTLSVPGVHTAIVGTTKPGRWRQNAALLEAGALAREEFEAISARWREVAGASWTGQV